jgi:hypothetical protein
MPTATDSSNAVVTILSFVINIVLSTPSVSAATVGEMAPIIACPAAISCAA